MKKIQCFALPLIAVIMALSLAACDKTPTPTPDSTVDTTTSAPETTASLNLAEIIKDGVCDYTIIRPDGADGALVSAVVSWCDAFNKSFGTSVRIKTDWDRDNRDNNTVESDASVHEILVGGTNRAESKQVAAEAGLSCGYAIRYLNGKLVIWGTDTNTTVLALDYLSKTLSAEGGSLTLPGDYNVLWSMSGEGSVGWQLMTQYKIVRSSTASDRVTNAVSSLRSSLGSMTDMTINTATDAKEATGKEILVGETKRAESIALAEELTYMDYTIRITADKILIQGGSPLATEQATKKFVELLQTDKIKSLDGGYEYSWKFKDVRPDSVIFNLEAFKPIWADAFTAPAWMRNFDEKAYACVCPTGRMSADAHRGDNQNYPENSAEGILSAVLLGADTVEIDPRLTKDGVIVLLHDATLTRTTDFASKKGKNGLPTSDKVSDWTYEQLLQLNLKSGRGGSSAKVTEYKICTAYEAVAIMAGNCMIHWDCKDNAITRDTDTYLLAAELGAKANFYYYYNDSVMQTWYNKDTSDTDFKEFLDRMASYTSQSGFKRRSRNFDFISKFGDDLNGWNQHLENGCRMVFTNHIYDITRHIAANEQPLQYK